MNHNYGSDCAETRTAIRQVLGVMMGVCFMTMPSNVHAQNNKPTQTTAIPDIDKLVGQPANLAPWAYLYRTDVKKQATPEAYFIPRRLELIEQRGDRTSPPGRFGWKEEPTGSPAPTGRFLCGLLWEGRMPMNRIELHWPKAGSLPTPETVEVRVYPGLVGWWGKTRDRILKTPTISADGRVWVYQPEREPDYVASSGKKSSGNGRSGVDDLCEAGNPLKDWYFSDMVTVFVNAQEGADNATTPVTSPTVQIFALDKWKRMDIEIEWGLKPGTEQADFDGRVEGYFGIVGPVAALPEDATTKMDGSHAWQSRGGGKARRGIVLPLLYIEPPMAAIKHFYLPGGKVDSARATTVTVWTKGGSFTFLMADLERGAILAPEYGFFVTKAGSGQTAKTYAAELKARNLKGVREMTREHRESTWEDAMREINAPLVPNVPQVSPTPNLNTDHKPPKLPLPGETTLEEAKPEINLPSESPPKTNPPPPTKMGLPPYPNTDYETPMHVTVPESRWSDAWRRHAWQLAKGPYSYKNLGMEHSRTMLAMERVGISDVVTNDLTYWFKKTGAKPEGDFADGQGSFQDPGYDAVHTWATPLILRISAEHYLFTRDLEWLRQNRPRLQKAADWIVRQRKSYMKDVHNRERLAVAGLQPPSHWSDGNIGQFQWHFFLHTDAWSCFALRRFAEALADVDVDEAMKYREESEDYRRDIVRALDRAIALSPVRPVRNGTYRSFIPDTVYVRGDWARWGVGHDIHPWLHSEPTLLLVEPTGILPVDDPRVEGHMDVLEDVRMPDLVYFKGFVGTRRNAGLSSEEDWFWGGFAGQWGYSYIGNVYLRRDEDVPCFLRTFMNTYAAFADPREGRGGRYLLSEHFSGPGSGNASASRFASSHSLGTFMEWFRALLVIEEGESLWLARATPRAWLEQGKKISVKNAPTHFGTVDYEIVSDVDNGEINTTVKIPSRNPPKEVSLRLRHPKSAPIETVTVNGKDWKEFNKDKETITLKGLTGTVAVLAKY